MEELERLDTELTELCAAYYDRVNDLFERVRAKALTNAELTDVGYLCRKHERILDEWRKDCKARQEMCGHLIAWNIASSPEGQDGDLVRGRLARAKVTMSMLPVMPKKDTPEYVSLLAHFGVHSEYARLSWQMVKEYITRLKEEGKDLPKELADSRPEFKCVFTKMK